MIDYNKYKSVVDFEKSVVDIISVAEEIRELGHARRAGRLLNHILLITEGNRVITSQLQNSLIAQITSQVIVCYKHLYQNERQDSDLELMELGVKAMLVPNILTEEQKSVFYLRAADVANFKGDHESAEEFANKAYNSVSKGGFVEAEYLGHLAEAKANNGKYSYAVNLLIKALKIMEGVNDVRTFHKLIIVSGLYGRLVRPAFENGKYWLSVKSLWRCYRISRELAKVHKMPQRLNQFYLRLQGKTI